MGGCSNIGKQKHHSISILEFGIYSELDTVDYLESKTSASEGTYVTRFNSSKILRTTDVVKLNKSTNFGLYYQINFANQHRTKVKVNVYYHSEMYNPKTDKSSKIETLTFKRKTNTKYFTGYSLSHDYELLEGDWTIEIVVDDKRIDTHTI